MLIPLCLSLLSAIQQPSAPPEFRLPETVKPASYVIELQLDPEIETFKGKVTIDLELKEAATTIWMNGRDLTIESASIASGGATQPAKTLTENEDFLGFQVDKPVPAGRATMTIAYSGKISSASSSGVFRNQDLNNWYIYTQFEAIEARSAFPSFDEPHFKTPWQLTLRVKKEHDAFANTPVAKVSESADGWKTIQFAESKPLPTYLVAFAVGPFETVDAGKVGRKPTPLRIIVPRGRTAEAKWAVESTGPIVAWLENYFDLPYPYEKLDSIAVPLFGGAMENPGLITYGQAIILSKPEEDSVNRRRMYASIAAHEIAHIWFGDLVTMKWWDDLWLNEGFATWMPGKAIAAWKPEWDVTTTSTSERLAAMNADSLISARKVRQPANTKDDIANAFDNITYGKAGATIHMFEQWIGPDVFRRGVKGYMDKHAHRNATAADFMQALGTAAGRDIASAFSTFLDQPGLPQVAAELTCEQGNPPALKLSQKRYLPLGSPRPAPQTWQIPVCFEYGSGQTKERECALLKDTAAEIAIQSAKACPEWVLLNDDYNGYYRSQYTGSMLTRVLEDPTRLSASERLGLLRDAFALVRSGDLRYAQALELTTRFANDQNREVTRATAVIVERIHRDMVPDELRQNYVRFVQKNYGERARALGWTEKAGEDDDTKLLRASLVELVAGPGQNASLRREASALARKWLDDRKALTPDIAGVVLGIAAREGGRDLWEQYNAAAKKSTDENERGAILSAMGQFRDPAIVKNNFDLIGSGQIDPRESFGLLFGGLEHPETRELPYKFVTEHYDELSSKMASTMGFDLRTLLPYVGLGFCSADKRAEVEAFFKARMANVTGGPRVLAEVLEEIGQCEALRKAQQASVVEFLKRF